MTTSTFPFSSGSPASLAVAWTGRSDGDFHPIKVEPDTLLVRQRAITDRSWTMLDQRHTTTVVRVERAGQHRGSVADGAISTSDEAALAVWVGDCAPIVLIGTEKEFAVLHAGWRGLAGGIIDEAMTAFTEPVAQAVLGPVICGKCYEFGVDDLMLVADGIGVEPEAISSRTIDGTIGLDVERAVRARLGAHGVATLSVGGCPSCDPAVGFSHRGRSEGQRHAMVAWKENR